ncbi:hypothetical protein EJB05_10952, partial [Eragrostis curvula]
MSKLCVLILFALLGSTVAQFFRRDATPTHFDGLSLDVAPGAYTSETQESSPPATSPVGSPPQPYTSYPPVPNPPTPSQAPPAASPVGSPQPYTSYPPVPSPPMPSQAPPPSSPGPKLRYGFYRYSCPRAEQIVRDTVRNATSRNPGIGAGLIRMAFHDCFVQGCDASVLLDPTPANPRPEKLGPPNFPSLRGFEVIDAAKAKLEAACPGTVSCADIVQFAGRDASFFLSNGTINYGLPGGRFDGRISFENETLAFLPPPSFNLTELIDSFRVKGLNVDDLVVLSGSHTVGRSHCSSFSDRISTPPSNMDPGLATVLKRQCPANPNLTNDPTVVQDVVTPTKMDNQYYKNVLRRKVLFTSDAALLTSRRTARKVVENAVVRGRWERKFARAMVKMANIEIKTIANGEIRRNCRIVN